MKNFAARIITVSAMHSIAPKKKIYRPRIRPPTLSGPVVTGLMLSDNGVCLANLLLFRLQFDPLDANFDTKTLHYFFVHADLALH